jgi:hypothetical protein
MLYVFNLALRKEQENGTFKVENDTLFSESILDASHAKNIADMYSCDVIVSTLGTYKPFKESLVNKYTYVYMFPKSEKKESENGNADSESSDSADGVSAESKSNSDNIPFTVDGEPAGIDV